ncbi:septum formation family protein [Streptomyces althioticus]
MMTRAPYRSPRGPAAVAALLALTIVGCSEASEVVDDAKDGARKAARQRSVFSLDVGDCYNPNGKAEGEAYLVEVVPCDEAHQGEVVGEFSMESVPEYPGDEKIVGIADERCAAEAQRYAPDTWALPAGVGLSHYTPTRESWATGDRAVSCTYTVEKGTFKGSLNTAKSFEPDQLTFLKGSNSVYETLWAHQPVTDDVEAALKDYRAQAEAVAAALGTHVEGLGGIDGSEVGKLRATLTKAAGQWEKAADAPDADAFYLAYDQAFTLIDPGKTVAARKELGLATTIPAEDAEVWAS